MRLGRSGGTKRKATVAQTLPLSNAGARCTVPLPVQLSPLHDHRYCRLNNQLPPPAEFDGLSASESPLVSLSFFHLCRTQVSAVPKACTSRKERAVVTLATETHFPMQSAVLISGSNCRSW